MTRHGLAHAGATAVRRSEAARLHLGLQAFDRRLRDALRGVALNATHHADVTALGQGHSQTAATSTTGTANAVHIVFGLHGHAVVDHVGDRGHVDAASGHVGGDQHAQLTAAQALQHAVAATLRHATVQGGHGVTHVSQAVGQDVGVALRAGEDHGLIDGLVGQQMVQQLVLVLQAVGQVQTLFDVVMAVGVRRHFDGHGIAGQTRSQLAHVTGKGRAEHQGLTLGRGALDDGFDVIDEAHVQHAVGFVQDQHFQVVEHGRTGVQVVEQTARGGDQHIQRALQSLELVSVRHAAHHGGDTQTLHVATIGVSRLGHLHGQFAGRCQHQHAGAVNLALFAALGVVATGGNDALQRRQHERGGLAAARAGGYAQVGALHGSRDGLDLDGGRLGVTRVSQGAAQLRAQAQIIKARAGGFFFGRVSGFRFHAEHFGFDALSQGVQLRRSRRGGGVGDDFVFVRHNFFQAMQSAATCRGNDKKQTPRPSH